MNVDVARRAFLKGAGLVAGVAPAAVLPMDEANAEAELMPVLVGKRTYLARLLKISIALGQHPLEASYEQIKGRRHDGNQTLMMMWHGDFSTLLHGNYLPHNPADRIDGLKSVRLDDITLDRLKKAAQSAGDNWGDNELEKCIAELRKLRSLGFQTVEDVQNGLGRRMLSHLPGIIDDKTDIIASARNLESCSEDLENFSHDFPDVFKGFPNFPEMMREKNRLWNIPRLVTSPRLPRGMRQALAEAARQKRRFSVARNQNLRSEWQSFEIRWGKGENEPTRVIIHLLRLRLCSSKILANDSYKPGDITVEPNGNKRSVIVSTRDSLMKRHLEQCMYGEKALFPTM